MPFAIFDGSPQKSIIEAAVNYLAVQRLFNMLCFDGKLALLSSVIKGESAEAVEVMSHDLDFLEISKLKRLQIVR